MVNEIVNNFLLKYKKALLMKQIFSYVCIVNFRIDKTKLTILNYGKYEASIKSNQESKGSNPCPENY